MKLTYEELEQRCQQLEKTIATIADLTVTVIGDNGTPSIADMAGGMAPKFFYDKELRKAIESIIWNYTLDESHQILLEKFGKERTPSRSALGRYQQRLRKGRVKVENGQYE
jgi:hypothetical protein